MRELMRPRVLVIAEACNPEWTSVPLVGWQHTEALREVADVHLVTQIRNRDAIARQGWREGEDFTAIDSEAVAKTVYKFASLARGGDNKGWTTLMALTTPSHYWFEHLVWRAFKRRLRAHAFDIVHRVTPLSPTVPSPIAEKCQKSGVPFVIGPLNGGVPWPKGFRDVMRAEREWLSHVRGAYKLLPHAQRTRDCAAAIITASRHAYDEMPARVRDRLFYVAENAVDPKKFRVRRTPSTSTAGTGGRPPLRLIFVGRLVPYKGADIVVEAASALLKRGDAVLDIVGDGPERARIEALVQRLGVRHAVTMAGWLEHKDVAARFAQADVLAFPSVREFGGGVVLEAMAVGVVPVVVDYGGPGELITPKEGVAVPLSIARDGLVHRMRVELEALAADPARVEAMSTACLARVDALYTWPRKAEQIASIYRWVLAQDVKPRFDPPARAPAAR